jgi:hypothetical protein
VTARGLAEGDSRSFNGFAAFGARRGSRLERPKAACVFAFSARRFGVRWGAR